MPLPPLTPEGDDKIVAGKARRGPTPQRGNCRRHAMITNDQELEATRERIRHFQDQLASLRKVETNPVNDRLSASGFLAEIERMQLQVRKYLSVPADEVAAGV